MNEIEDKGIGIKTFDKVPRKIKRPAERQDVSKDINQSIGGFQCSFLFLDPCALTTALSLVEEFGAAYTARFIQHD